MDPSPRRFDFSGNMPYSEEELYSLACYQEYRFQSSLLEVRQASATSRNAHPASLKPRAFRKFS